jgi:hypothetical protein
MIGLLNPENIIEIQNETELINGSLDSFRKTINSDINVYKDLNPNNYSFESVDISNLGIINLTRYYNSTGIRKAIVHFVGEISDLNSEYYYKNESLVFVNKILTSYENPKWSDDFNMNEKEIRINQYFIKNNKLVCWIDTNKNKIELANIHEEYVKNVLSDSELYKKY